MRIFCVNSASLALLELVKLGDSAFEVEVQAWLGSSDHGGFRDWRQEMLLGFVEVIEQARSSRCRAPHPGRPSRIGRLGRNVDTARPVRSSRRWR